MKRHYVGSDFVHKMMSAVLCPSAEKRERGLALLRQCMDLQGQATQPAAGQMYREGFLAALRVMDMAPLQGPSSIPPSALGQQVKKLRDRHAQTQDRLTHTHTHTHTHAHIRIAHTHSHTHCTHARVHTHPFSYTGSIPAPRAQLITPGLNTIRTASTLAQLPNQQQGRPVRQATLAAQST